MQQSCTNIHPASSMFHSFFQSLIFFICAHRADLPNTPVMSHMPKGHSPKSIVALIFFLFPPGFSSAEPFLLKKQRTVWSDTAVPWLRSSDCISVEVVLGSLSTIHTILLFYLGSIFLWQPHSERLATVPWTITWTIFGDDFTLPLTCLSYFFSNLLRQLSSVSLVHVQCSTQHLTKQQTDHFTPLHQDEWLITRSKMCEILMKDRITNFFSFLFSHFLCFTLPYQRHVGIQQTAAFNFLSSEEEWSIASVSCKGTNKLAMSGVMFGKSKEC